MKRTALVARLSLHVSARRRPSILRSLHISTVSELSIVTRIRCARPFRLRHRTRSTTRYLWMPFPRFRFPCAYAEAVKFEVAYTCTAPMAR